MPTRPNGLKFGKRPLSLVLLALLALSFAAMPGAHANAAPSGTLRVGWTSPTNLDPALFADAPDISFGAAVYNYLFTLDQKSALLPSLAKSATPNADATVYTVALQSGVKFQDGSDFSADDVKFTFGRFQDPALKSGASGLFADVSAIDVVDPLTVKFTLKNPNSIFPLFLADYHTAILKKGTTDPAKAHNGTGPFKVDSIDVTSRAEFSANPTYWKAGLPKIAKLEFIFVKSTPDSVPALRGGQLDWASRLPLESYLELKGDSSVVASTIATNQFSNVRIRSDRKPGSDPKVRQALRLGLDRDAINKLVFQGLAAPGNDTPVGPLYGSLLSKDTVPKRDVAGAKKLLADAGYPNGLTLDFAVPQGEQNSEEVAQAVQAQWKDIGVTTNLKVIDQSVYYGDDKSPLYWTNADLAVTLWASRPDPQLYLDQLYKSGAAYNEAHYNNPDLDKLIDNARKETDATKRAAIFADIQKLLISDGPSYVAYFQPLFTAQAKNVSGIDVSPDPGLTSFENAVVGS